MANCSRHAIFMLTVIVSVGAGWAGQTELRLAEPLRRSWAPAVVHFDVELPKADFKPKTFRVVDGAGRPVAFQVSDVFRHPERPNVAFALWLRTGLEPWEVKTWTLHYGGDEAETPPTDMTVTRDGDAWVLANAKTAVRVPAGEKTFAAPVDPSELPAPVQAVRGRSGRWLGRGWLVGPQKAVAWRSELTAAGPIFAEVVTTYTFVGGRYVVRVQLATTEDVIMVKETFDLGDPSAARDQHFCFSLYEGLEPDTLRWRGRYWDKTLTANKPAAGYKLHQEAVAPLDYQRDRSLVRLLGLFCWWPESAHYWAAYRKDEPEGDLVGIFRARAGYWRNPTCLFLDQRAEPDLVVRCPIRQPVQEWIVDGVDYDSPYYTGVVAPGTPASHGRRQWGLVVSTPAEAVPENDDMTKSEINRAMIRHGSNPLDKIKGWTLDWDGPGHGAYPRGWFRRDQLPALRERAKTHKPIQKLLTSAQHKPFRYLVTGDPALGRELLHNTARGDANWMGILPMLRWSVGKYFTEGDLGYHTFMHHGIGLSNRAALLFDVAMGVPEMTADERREARSLFAFLNYKLADEDWLAKRSGFHLGNPNMPTAAENQIGANACLLPNHPRSITWAQRAIANCVSMLDGFVAPGGAWRECPHYQHDAAMKQILRLALPLRNAGYADLFRDPGLKATMLYAAQILTPVDPRFGIRTVPSIGNSSHESTSNFGRMAIGTQSTDPAYAAWMQWAHRAVGAPYFYKLDELILDPTLPSEAPDLSSRVFPGFGAILRGHVGTEQEVYLSFRIGKWVEHYENDQGSIVFHAKGAPLCDDFGSIYQPPMVRPWLHNRVAIDHKADWDSRGRVTAHAFLGLADYVAGTVPIARLHPLPEDPWTKTPPNAPWKPAIDIPTVEWTREILLLKDHTPEGLNYVVMRDRFAGTPTKATEWTLWCLANTVDARPGLAQYKGQLGVDLDLTILDPADQAPTTGQYGHKGLFYNGGFWRKQNPGKKWEEVQHYVRLKREPGSGYFVVLYPRLPTDPAVTFKLWAGGAGATAEIDGVRHIVALAPETGTYREADVELVGRAASVRRGPDTTSLVLSAGSRLRAGDLAIEGAAPVAATLSGETLVIESNLASPATLAVTAPAGVAVPSATRRNGRWYLAMPAGNLTLSRSDD